VGSVIAFDEDTAPRPSRTGFESSLRGRDRGAGTGTARGRKVKRRRGRASSTAEGAGDRVRKRQRKRCAVAGDERDGPHIAETRSLLSEHSHRCACDCRGTAVRPFPILEFRP